MSKAIRLRQTKVDDLVKSQKAPFPVIPAKAGIQLFQGVIKPLDSGFHLSARHRQAGVTTFYKAIKIDGFVKSPVPVIARSSALAG
ncbi:MAG: hypothetical protein FJ117_14150 [Deltaproteobacteria bacterium]|nr:hypothetical protein [Deltaproteobacteria bacterium]